MSGIQEGFLEPNTPIPGRRPQAPSATRPTGQWRRSAAEGAESHREHGERRIGSLCHAQSRLSVNRVPLDRTTHPVLVDNVRDDDQLAILRPVVHEGHAPNLDVARVRHGCYVTPQHTSCPKGPTRPVLGPKRRPVLGSAGWAPGDNYPRDPSNAEADKLSIRARTIPALRKIRTARRICTCRQALRTRRRMEFS